MAFTFNPPVDPLPGSIEVQPRILRTKFSDGYSVRAEDGLNTQKQMLSPIWEAVTETEKDQIISFMEARGGYQSFIWTLPGETTSRSYLCTKWTHERIALNVYRIALNFEEVFDI